MNDSKENSDDKIVNKKKYPFTLIDWCIIITMIVIVAYGFFTR